MFENVRDLTRFLAVAERGNILAAAEHLGLAQPALSYTITRVERRFGAALFERHSQGVRLTALGAAAAERGRRVLREIEDGEADLYCGALAGGALPPAFRREPLPGRPLEPLAIDFGTCGLKAAIVTRAGPAALPALRRLRAAVREAAG